MRYSAFFFGLRRCSVGGVGADDGWRPRCGRKRFVRVERVDWKPHAKAVVLPDAAKTRKELTQRSARAIAGIFTVAPVDGKRRSTCRPGLRELRTENRSPTIISAAFKWGQKQWAAARQARTRATADCLPRAFRAGAEAHLARSIELQIQEHDVGDLYRSLVISVRRNCGLDAATNFRLRSEWRVEFIFSSDGLDVAA